jgi:hypothetical protein
MLLQRSSYTQNVAQQVFGDSGTYTKAGHVQTPLCAYAITTAQICTTLNGTSNTDEHMHLCNLHTQNKQASNSIKKPAMVYSQQRWCRMMTVHLWHRLRCASSQMHKE